MGKVREYQVKGLIFRDRNKDGVLSAGDEVIAGRGGKAQKISGDRFISMVHGMGIEVGGVRFKDLSRALARFSPDSKKVAGLLLEPKNGAALLARSGVKKVETDVPITYENLLGRNEKRTLVGNYVIPESDLGARSYLAKQGYGFVRQGSSHGGTRLIAIRSQELRDLGAEIQRSADRSVHNNFTSKIVR